MSEPTVLDFVKALLTPWKGPPPAIPPLPGAAELAEGAGFEGIETPGEAPPLGLLPEAVAEPAPAAATQVAPKALPAPKPSSVPWASLSAFLLALLAQMSFEPAPGGERGYYLGAALYVLAAFWLIWAVWRGEWALAEPRPAQAVQDPLTVRWVVLISGVIATLSAYVAFGDGTFTFLNLFFWLWAVAAFIFAFWLPRQRVANKLAGEAEPDWVHSQKVDRWLFAAVIALVLVFRLFQLNEVPSEMVSDQAEKLLDVSEVLGGQYSIFFPRNTGREAFQFYLTAAIAGWFGTGLSFLSLKIGTVLAGLLTLPFIYRLGVELGNKRVGLLAVALMGIGYWPNVISRFGLRFPFYMLFTAPVLFYLLRGLRTNNRNDFLLAGLALGVGMHGYTPFRIVPFVVLAAAGIYLLHRHSKGYRMQTLVGLTALIIISVTVFLPLLRYWHDNPDIFALRAISRVSTIEAPLPGPAWRLFIENTWRAMTMFAWDDGEIWVISVTHRPALDAISAALFYLGGGLLTLRYLRKRHWADLFLLLAVPLLLLPSILSLAFPAENPALNRASAAAIPVFLIAAIALDGLLTAISAWAGTPRGRNIALATGILLITLSAGQNYNLVFRQYRTSFDSGAHNTSELGGAIRSFGVLTGETDTAWVVAYPHWVDTRLVGMNAGVPLRDFAIWPEGIAATSEDPRAKLFIINPADTAGLDKLKEVYPQGTLTEYPSQKGKNFYIFFVAPSP